MPTEVKHTPGPWKLWANEHGAFQITLDDDDVRVICARNDWSHRAAESVANARLIAAAPDLLEAAMLLEAAEDGRQDCEECEDEGEPEACGTCFPKFDDARIKRRLAIAKARVNRN